MADSARLPALPAVLEEIAAVAGHDAAWALARAKGGTTVFLPDRVPHRHWLVDVVGHEAAQKLCTHFRSNHQSRVKIPLASIAQKSERWTRVINSDLSLNESALEMGVDSRTVSNWRARIKRRNPPDQGGLF